MVFLQPSSNLSALVIDGEVTCARVGWTGRGDEIDFEDVFAFRRDYEPG